MFTVFLEETEDVVVIPLTAERSRQKEHVLFYGNKIKRINAGKKRDIDTLY